MLTYINIIYNMYTVIHTYIQVSIYIYIYFLAVLLMDLRSMDACTNEQRNTQKFHSETNF